MTVPGLGKKRSRIRRSWDLATAKIAAEESRCRVCGSRFGIERAHIIGREHDATEPINAEFWKPYTVAPDRIVGLCAECHRAYDSRQLDVLPYLTLDEQVQATADAGGIAPALYRLMPSENPKRVDRAPWGMR